MKLIRREMLDDVARHIHRLELVLHRLPLRQIALTRAEHRRWFLNVNTPAEFAVLKNHPR